MLVIVVSTLLGVLLLVAVNSFDCDVVFAPDPGHLYLSKSAGETVFDLPMTDSASPTNTILYLLYKYGGVWIDGSVFLNKPLLDWLPTDKMFTYRADRFKDLVVCMETFFIYSPKNNNKLFGKYWNCFVYLYLKILFLLKECTAGIRESLVQKKR